MKIAGVAAEATGSAVSGVLRGVFKVVGTILLICLLTGIFLAFIGVMYINRYIIPNADLDLGDYALDQTSFIYYKDPNTGEDVLWQELHSTENRVWVDYEEMPEYLMQAVVAIEDHRFYNHNGVDWKRTGGAFLNMFLGGSSGNFGGSTLTQQLIKNLTEYDEVTVKRKILEIFRALEFEKKYTKEDILEWYLNTVYLGQGCYGIGTAAETYFGKEPSQLTLAECASIIGITNAPTKYNPYLNPENNTERKETILFRMEELGIISNAEYEASMAEPVVFQPLKSSEETGTQSYYLDAVINDVIDDLMEEKGVSEKIASRMLYRGGYHIYACVDMSVQEKVDSVFANSENFPEVYGIEDALPEGAIVIMDPYTGEVVALYGGRGAKTGLRTWNRATMSTRQPGSSIKPVTVYAPAIELGAITPNSVIVDGPLKKINGKDWPKNQNRKYSGPTTVTRAVELSLNTVAAKVVDMISPQRSFDFATQNLGLTTLVSYMEKNGKTFSDIDLAPMSLGGLTKGVRVVDLTASYAAFANKGVFTEPRTYSLIVDSNGDTVIDNSAKTRVAMKESTAWYMNYMLQSVVSRGTGTQARLGGGIATAGKTGTTDDDYDRWFVGYTPYYVSAVWFGYDISQEIKLTRSTNPALNLWKQVMSKVHEGLEGRDFFEMETVRASYCEVTGMKPTQNCPSATGIFVRGDAPSEYCTGHDGIEWPSESPSPSPSPSESPSVSPSSSITDTPTPSQSVPPTQSSPPTPSVPVTDPPTVPPTQTHTPTEAPVTDPPTEAPVG